MPRGGPRPGSGRPRGRTGPVRATIAKRKAIDRRLELGAERLAAELSSLSQSDLGQFFDHAGKFLPIADIPPALRRCISSIKVTKKNLTSGDGKQEDIIEIKLWDKLKAIEMVAKHQGYLIERQQVTGPNGGPLVFTWQSSPNP